MRKSFVYVEIRRDIKNGKGFFLHFIILEGQSRGHCLCFSPSLLTCQGSADDKTMVHTRYLAMISTGGFR